MTDEPTGASAPYTITNIHPVARDPLKDALDVQITLPESDQPSRIRKPKTEPEYVDDVVTADDRIAAFWRKFKDGKIATGILNVDADDEESAQTFSGATVGGHGHRRFTVRAEVYKDADSETPDAVAHATRGTDDYDPITASRPQETAETAAVSRALRYLGIKLPKAPK